MGERLSAAAFPPKAGLRWSHWQALSYFGLYRLLLSGLLVLLIWWVAFPRLAEARNPALYTRVAHGYVIYAVLALLSTQTRWPRFNLQVLAQALADIACLELLIHSNVGLASGFGMLLVVAVTGSSILTTWKTAIFIAAVASLSVLGGELYTAFTPPASSPDYVHAGFLGMAFFMCSAIGQALAARVKDSETLVEQHAIALENLSQLNDYIVYQMHLGVLVLDDRGRIQQCNHAASEMLHMSRGKGMGVAAVSAPLQRCLDEWRARGGEQSSLAHIAESGREVRLSFINPHISPSYDTLIFIEDVATFKQRVQQTKLASLGRLTASIAHEVRNPLGAISNAGQLLLESDTLGEEERQLGGIVLEHANRVNRIVENVLSISRRESGTPEQIELGAWLCGFAAELREARTLRERDICVQGRAEPLHVSVDATQLRQVVWNLAENALRYSTRSPRLTFCYGVRSATIRPWLDVRDQGGGIPQSVAESLFEPFVTTEREGSGMGLYIARELCEANRANLVLHANSEAGCCFRINFFHAEKS